MAVSVLGGRRLKWRGLSDPSAGVRLQSTGSYGSLSGQDLGRSS